MVLDFRLLLAMMRAKPLLIIIKQVLLFLPTFCFFTGEKGLLFDSFIATTIELRKQVHCVKLHYH